MDLYEGKNRKQFFVGLVMILLLVSPTFYTLSRISDLKETIAQTNDRNEAMVSHNRFKILTSQPIVTHHSRKPLWHLCSI